MPPILRGFRVAVPVCVSAAVSFLSLRCCLFVGSHLIRNQLIAQIGIVRHCKTIANTSIRRRVATTRRRHKSRHHSHTTATARPRPGCDGRHGHDVRDVTPQPRPQRPWHDGHGAATATTDTAAIAYKGTCPRDTTRHAKTQSHKRSNVAPCNKHPRGGVPPPGQEAGAAGSLVLTLNARWNIFGLPVTYEVFTYLVVATVSAPYILCIMFLGLMLMVVERSSGPHRYLAAITHCA